MMPDARTLWLAAALPVLGAALTAGVVPQRYPGLRAPLAEAVPERVGPWEGRDVEISEAEQRVAGFTDYLMRSYEADGRAGFSVYVGFYDSQARGRTIHSPKNCMPGAGWQALESTTIDVPTGDGRVLTANRYLLQRDDERALVVYWYQGRGRTVASEYRAKWELLRDAAVKRRSDEAVVRIVVPVVEDVATARDLAVDVARRLVAPLDAALPG